MYARIIGAAVAVLCLLYASNARAGEPDWNRSGFYVALTGGYDLADAKALDRKLEDKTWFVGGIAGFNGRVDRNLVLGLEGDWMFVDVKASHNDGGFQVTASSHYLASVRARAGLPLGPVLLFATGGVAFSDHKLGIAVEDFSAADKKVLIGGVIGAGIESELTRTLFVRAEVLHFWFPDSKFDLSEATLKSGQTQTIPRIAVGFKLN